MYASELPGEQIETIEFPDNQKCIDMLESRTEQSFFKIMEEELVMRSRDDNVLLAKLDDRLKHFTNYKKSKFGGSKQFSISHYAMDVTYDIDGFLMKNMDQSSDAVTQTIELLDVLGTQ